MKERRGKFIVFEGLDHSGKSTQAKILTDYLIAKGIKAELISFPSIFQQNIDRTTEIGSVISRYLKSSLALSNECIHLLFSANRWEYKYCYKSKDSEYVKTKLMSGTYIIADRYAYSGVAYSGAKVMMP